MPDRRTRSHHRLVPLALAVALSSLMGIAAAGPATAWDGGSFNAASERALVTLTNRSRAAAGLRALRVDSALTSVARWRSKDMIQRDYFSLAVTGMASWALDAARVTVARDVDNGLSLAIAEIDLG